MDLAGGIVAHNDEARIESSIRSLLDQELPSGSRWSNIWVVASGCTDRTADVVRSIAARESLVCLVEQPERRGKAAAVQEVLRRARGDRLVLLNSDAVALPGAVRALSAVADRHPTPHAVMGRPVVPDELEGEWSEALRWMWHLHHELHLATLREGRGTHLSDELLLVSLPAVAGPPEGVINDGAYVAVWLAEHGGGCWYAPEAEVRIDVPRRAKDHLAQRRRIHVGDAQVGAMLGRRPASLLSYLLAEPQRAWAALGRANGRPNGIRHFLHIAAWELASHLLSVWDRIPPRRDHVRWERISTLAPKAQAFGTAGAATAELSDERVSALLRIAHQFETGIPLDRLTLLLPESAPADPGSLADWLRGRPAVGKVEEGRAFHPASPARIDQERVARGERCLAEGQALFRGPLAATRPWVRCLAITGSAAYGEPGPGDDLDLFVVTQTGAQWCFLAWTYLALRVQRWKDRSHAAGALPPCFNYVLDDVQAPIEFAQGRGLLFAREALSARVIAGEDYFRGLLGVAPWMGEELPRLYRSRAGPAGSTSGVRAPVGVRLASAMAFPLLATYLQLTTLYRSARERRRHGANGAFRAVTRWRRLAFESRRFDTLRVRYDLTVTAPAASVESAGGTLPPKPALSR
jgi:poly-beta-1,6-N-acetyl-D-glucosamine synthase